MKNIARIRKVQGLNQSELAALCGVDQATISRAERGDGKVSLTVYKSIAENLDVPLHVLFAPDADGVDIKLMSVFHHIPEDRKLGWLDTIDGILASRETQPQ